MEATKTYGGYGSHVEFMLKGTPEVMSFFPGKGNVAVNLQIYGDTYRVAIGERVGDEFREVATSPGDPLPEGVDLKTLVEREVEPFGEKSRIFDLFVAGELVREASQ